MAIAFACPRCGKTFQVDDTLAGKKARCKDCRAVLLIPKAATPSIDGALEAIREQARPARSRSSQSFDEVIARARYEPAEPEPTVQRGFREREWRLPLEPAQMVGVLVLLGSLASIAFALIAGSGGPNGAVMRSKTLGIVGLVWLAWGGVWTIMACLDSDELSLFMLFRIPFLIVLTWLGELRAFLLVAVGGFLVFSTGILQRFPDASQPRNEAPPPRDARSSSWFPRPRPAVRAEHDSRFPPPRLDVGSLTPGPSSWPTG